MQHQLVFSTVYYFSEHETTRLFSWELPNNAFIARPSLPPPPAYSSLLPERIMAITRKDAQKL